MALSVEEAIARVPKWANADDLKISPLSGGITNNNFRYRGYANRFFARVFDIIKGPRWDQWIKEIKQNG